MRQSFVSFTYRLLFLRKKRNNPKQQNSTDDCGNNMSNDGCPPVDSNPRKHIAADETANDTDKQIDNKTKSGDFHDLAGYESGKDSNDNTNNYTHFQFFFKTTNSDMPI